MDELVQNMTKSLRQYNGEANRAVIKINTSFMVVGYHYCELFLVGRNDVMVQILETTRGRDDLPLNVRSSLKVPYCLLFSSHV